LENCEETMSKAPEKSDVVNRTPSYLLREKIGQHFIQWLGGQSIHMGLTIRGGRGNRMLPRTAKI